MKIRIKNASIRLRLSTDDMQALAQQRYVSAKCPIGPEIDWTYRLSVDDHEEPMVRKSCDGIEVLISQSVATSLTSLEAVGHTFVIDNGTSAGLTLLLERDFKCLVDRPLEDETNLFPNPLAK